MNRDPAVKPSSQGGDGPLWRVARHFSVYSVGAGISLLTSVLLLPVYATQLSARQYGVVANGQVIGLFAITIARLGLNSGMFRFLAIYHVEGNASGADAIVTTSLAASLLSSLAATLAMLGGWAVIGSGSPSDVQVSGVLIAINVIVSAPTEMALFALRAKQDSTSYVVLSSASVILTTLITIVSVVGLHGGVAAVFASVLIANALTGVAGFAVLWRYLRPTAFSWAELRRSLRFGIPGVPALLADWVMQFSDRLFLTRFAGLGQAGIYSLGYRIGLIEQQILGTATTAAWDPFILSEHREPDGLQTIGRVASFLAMVGIALVLFISSAAPVLLTVIHARPEYMAATSVVFLIAFANFFAVLQHMLAAPTSIRLRPELGTLFRGLGAAVNIVLNFALITRFGMLGAAWSTLLTFVFTALITDVLSRRLMRMAFEYRKLLVIIGGGVLIQLVISLAQGSGSQWLIDSSPVWSVALFAGWLFATRSFSMGEARAVVRRLRRCAGDVAGAL